ncbi:MAG: sodium:solute symporter family transporter [candidate division WOR-3 bacterium]
MRVVIFAGYLAVLLVLALVARRRAKSGHEDFFLASRELGPVLLLVTLAATNFSAFTIFGFAGAGYRLGYAYYPIMAFGTGFMAITFLLIGVPAHRAAVATGAITPPELIYHRFKSRILQTAYLVVMVVFTLPYLALQPLGAGYMLSALFGIPYQVGAGLIVLVGVGYVLLGGLRGDAWTDLFQGVLMLGGMMVIFFALVAALGGFSPVSAEVAQRLPELFSRPGGGGFFTPGIWFSYLVLWFLCDPMFPQLFQRFLAAKGEQALRKSASFYPAITGVLFFFPVAIGVLAHSVLPDMAGKQTDQILPLVVNKTLSPFFAGVLTVVGLSALMSTMDSQLLTLSSMVIRDTRLLLGKPPEPRPRLQTLVIAVLALVGFLLALKPPGTILDIATETFTGLAVLFPVTMAGAYWNRANPYAGVASIVVGETMVVLYHLKLIPDFGFLPVIPVIGVTTVVLVLGSLFFPARGLAAWSRFSGFNRRWVLMMVLIFVLANDFWNWQRTTPLILGLPGWLWYHILLTFGLAVVLNRCRFQISEQSAVCA